jgi:hypothetical protein
MSHHTSAPRRFCEVNAPQAAENMTMNRRKRRKRKKRKRR